MVNEAMSVVLSSSHSFRVGSGRRQYRKWALAHFFC